ncbi:MAG: FAD-binding oxidoreductase [Actinomycetota bacterium]|nr:FAD-binding oxidoreductase [Actinomycetota bacterium]
MTRTAPDWDALQGDISGNVVLPSSPEYDSARKSAIARFHGVRPRAVVLCESPEDVSGTISFARRHGLRTATRSGGHCFAGRSSTEGIVIDVSPMRSVSVSGGMATVGAGARLGDVYDALAEHGLTIPAGSGPPVGISGLALGGGLGILGRKHGLTSDHLLGAQIVLADGSIIQCDEHHDGDLFWALRGAGGGNFGVVTSLTFDTIPAPAATVFHLLWPHTHAAAVIHAWQERAPTAPDELAASLLLSASGDVDEPPAVNVFGSMLGAESDAADPLDEVVIRAGADPTSVFRKRMSYLETKRYLAELGDAMAGDRPQGHPFSKSEFFRRPLPTEAIEALVENFTTGRSAGQSRELDFTPWGGAYNRVPADATAFVHRDERFLRKHVVEIDSEAPSAEREEARVWLARSWGSVHRWGSGGVYQNFPDPDLADWERAYYGTNLGRLVRAKRKYEPDNFFRFHQSLPNHVPGSGALP